MASVDRALARGNRLADRALRDVGDLVREGRVGAGLSQAEIGRAVGRSGSQVSRIERAKLPALSIMQASRIAAVIGLDLRVNAYPGAEPLRDAAHAERLRRVLEHVRPPLRYRVDVPLPQRPGQPTELRGRDAMLLGHGQRTAVELEMRIRDAQATIRRHELKLRDDPVERFLLVLADTRTNRRVLRENMHLFPDLPMLRKRVVFAALERGEHPPSGIIMI